MSQEVNQHAKRFWPSKISEAQTVSRGSAPDDMRRDLPVCRLHFRWGVVAASGNCGGDRVCIAS